MPIHPIPKPRPIQLTTRDLSMTYANGTEALKDVSADVSTGTVQAARPETLA
jgi:hypothetical protein